MRDRRLGFLSIPVQALIERGIVSLDDDSCFKRVLSPEAVAVLAESQTQQRIAALRVLRSLAVEDEVDSQYRRVPRPL